MRRLLALTVIGGLCVGVPVVSDGQVAKTPASSSKATLVFSRTGRGPMYIEGAIEFYRLLSPEGKKVTDDSRIPKSASVELDPGRYELVSYVRPCDGNCDLLDPPMDECRATFSIASGQMLYAVRQQTSTGACTLSVSNTPPKAP